MYMIVIFALVISLVSVSLYFIPMASDNQARINNLMCRSILEWSGKMEAVAAFLGPRMLGDSIHFPTVADAQTALRASGDAHFIATTLLYGGDLPLYARMQHTAWSLEYALTPYAEGYPTDLNFSQSANQIAGNLSQKIFNITYLMENSAILNPNGTSPAEIFDMFNSTDQIIGYCDAVINYTVQLKDISVKFAYP